MKRTILAALVAASCAQAAAANFYLVVPVPGKTASRASIQVALSPAQLPSVMRGAAYAYDFRPHLQVTGDNNFSGYGVKWAITRGGLPPGLALNPTTGVVSGAPTAGGTWPFSVGVTYMTKSGEQAYEVAVTSLSVTLDTANPVSAVVGAEYSFSLAPLLKVGGQPAGAGVSWSVVSNSLPSGLYLTADGRIAGAPSAAGTGRLTARASYQGFEGQQVYEVVALDISVGLASAVPPKGFVGEAYSYDLRTLLTVTGDEGYDAAAVTWSVVAGALPAGLTLNSASGLISGMPLSAGNTSVDVQATYRAKGTHRSYGVTIELAPAKARWNTAALDFGQVGLGGAEQRTVALFNDGASTGGNWTAINNLSGAVTADASACVNVAPGASCPVTFTFAPTAVAQVNLAGVITSGASRVQNSLALTGAGVQRVLLLSPAVNGRTSWNLDADGPLKLTYAGAWTVIPATSMRIRMNLWGAGGGGGGYDYGEVYSGRGGGGAFVGSPQLQVAKNFSFTAIVGGAGARGLTAAVGNGGGAGGYNGGGNGANAGPSGSSGAGGGGGGRTEVLSAGTQLACAGGGGGGGGDGSSSYANGMNQGNSIVGATNSKVGASAPQRSGDGGGAGGGGGGCNGGIASAYYPFEDSNGEGGAAGGSSAPGWSTATIIPAGASFSPANPNDAHLSTNARGGVNGFTGNESGDGTPGLIVIY